MRGECHITVSSAALCQRCPALMAYAVLRGEKNAWKVGIKGKGYYYGSLFHREIAKVFFDGACNPEAPLHVKISRALSGGRQEIESVIRENIFIPFLAAKSESCTSGQIIAMAEGIAVWVRAMSEFFALIPSLARSPEESMHTVFMKPEQKLEAVYKNGGIKMNVVGCYDALLFNPDRCEARLFEFKGYVKSDIAVPLSQSLIYSWLVWKNTGIIPSVEIIYLGSDESEIFTPSSVRDMIIAGLPGLFASAFSVIARRRLPDFMRDERLCAECPFRTKCDDDWRRL